ncbi:MAG TPA: hypothetical protein VGW10_05430 [Solirubrobacteraceae bacterium]|nr:hypothetical protein [Solirubrobacteraceae bacterium]
MLVAIAVLAVVAELLAYDGPAGLGAAAFGIAVGALLVHVVVPRTDRAAHGLLAWSFGLTALFTTVAFWSALPFAFAAGAYAAAGRATAPPAVLGAIATVIASVFCILA